MIGPDGPLPVLPAGGDGGPAVFAGEILCILEELLDNTTYKLYIDHDRERNDCIAAEKRMEA